MERLLDWPRSSFPLHLYLADNDLPPSSHTSSSPSSSSLSPYLHSFHLPTSAVDIPAHARTAHKGLLQKRTGKGSLLNRPTCPPNDSIGQGPELNWPLHPNPPPSRPLLVFSFPIHASLSTFFSSPYLSTPIPHRLLYPGSLVVPVCHPFALQWTVPPGVG